MPHCGNGGWRPGFEQLRQLGLGNPPVFHRVLAVNAGGDEDSVDAGAFCRGEVGADRVADGEDLSTSATLPPRKRSAALCALA